MIDSIGATVLLVYWTGIVTTMPKVFFFSPVIGLCFFFLWNIYVSWHIYCYTNTTNFIIFSQLLTCQFFTSRNKIIKYETLTNHNWKYMFWENVTTLIIITIFSQLLRSQFLIDQIKKCLVHNILTLISTVLKGFFFP